MSVADTGIKQPYIKHLQQTANDEHVHEMASNHGSSVHSSDNDVDWRAKTQNVKTRSDTDTHWSCSHGLHVIVLFPLVLVPDEHFHRSEGWIKDSNTAQKYPNIHYTHIQYIQYAEMIKML